VVHRVYAEEEEEQQQPLELSDPPQAPFTWRLSQRSRVVAVALLGAVVAFVAALAIHAAQRPSVGAHLIAPVDPSPVLATPPSRRESASPRVQRRQMRRRAHRSEPTLLTTKRQAIAPSSALAAPEAEVGSAASEFAFER
jgi:hypothetical protein